MKVYPVRKQISSNTTITTQEAADLLNVSHAYFIHLLESSEVPFRTIDAVHYLQTEDVLKYKDMIDKKRLKVLASLTAQAQELDMGY